MTGEVGPKHLEWEKKREQFRSDALAAWTAYQGTGRHLTGEEADHWLARLEAGEVVSPPECHG